MTTVSCGNLYDALDVVGNGILFSQMILLTIVVPKSQEIARSQLRTSNVDYFEGLIKPKKFNDTVKGLTIYAEDKNDKEEFINIYIKKVSKGKFQITFAKKGVFESKGNRKVLVLYDGENLTKNDGKITRFNFSKSDFGLENMATHLIVHRKLQEQSTRSLLDCVENIYFKKGKKILNCDTANPRNVYKELFKRFITPFYIPLLILIATMNCFISKENIRYLKYRFSLFVFGLSAIIVSESSLGYIQKSFTKNIFLISFPIFIVLLLYTIIFYKFKFKELRIQT